MSIPTTHTRPKPPFCQSYDEAQQIFSEGELQAWDGCMWVDIPKDSAVLFARRPEEYRRRPTFEVQSSAPKFFVRGYLRNRAGKFHMFDDAREAADAMWGTPTKCFQVFKQITLQSLDIKAIARQLEES